MFSINLINSSGFLFPVPFDFNQTLDSLLSQIGWHSDSVAKFSDEMDEASLDDYTHSPKTYVEDELWPEFKQYFPNEFVADNKARAEHGVALSELFFGMNLEQAIEQFGKNDLLTNMIRDSVNRPVAEIDNHICWILWHDAVKNALDCVLTYYVALYVDMAGDVSGPAKGAALTRYYGSKRVVYSIEHKGAFDFRAILSAWLRDPVSAFAEYMHTLAEKPKPKESPFTLAETFNGFTEDTVEAINESNAVVTFNENGQATHLMYLCKNQTPTTSQSSQSRC